MEAPGEQIALLVMCFAQSLGRLPPLPPAIHVAWLACMLSTVSSWLAACSPFRVRVVPHVTSHVLAPETPPALLLSPLLGSLLLTSRLTPCASAGCHIHKLS